MKIWITLGAVANGFADTIQNIDESSSAWQFFDADNMPIGSVNSEIVYEFYFFGRSE
ncbi:MAG: hypothetical protein HN356_07400 [Calditrichaeota bacterium]|nr:hypothetical protein [Calditrichota bacterium]MBT7789934.1 hypothetical protein [Calditrichota bacterium]